MRRFLSCVSFAVLPCVDAASEVSFHDAFSNRSSSREGTNPLFMRTGKNEVTKGSALATSLENDCAMLKPHDAVRLSLRSNTIPTPTTSQSRETALQEARMHLPLQQTSLHTLRSHCTMPKDDCVSKHSHEETSHSSSHHEEKTSRTPSPDFDAVSP